MIRDLLFRFVVGGALAAMKSDGTLDQLTRKWLKVYTSIPSLEP